jgi:hypothetical protein
VTDDPQLGLLGLEEGERLKKEGMAKVADHNGDWLAAARAEALRLALYLATVSVVDIRRWAEETDQWPDHPNCWGTVFKGGGWMPTGDWEKCQHPDGHARDVKIWARKHSAS